ncbi:MAG: hypothetical protein EBV15_01505 [Bacteroidetes bacterium]|nr:hypothetical protein [Bacteroidota bacterium]
MRGLSILVLAVLVVFGCRKDSLNKDGHESLSDWIKFSKNSRCIYRVDSIAFRRDNPLPDTFSFEYMEIVDTVFFDNVNEPAARMKIVTRKDSLDFWQFRRMYYAKTTEAFYERIEDNIRLLKISFPPAEDVLWNLNSRNNLPPVMLSYQNLYEPYQGEFMKSDTTLTVVGKEINNALEKYKYLEVYGKGIGLMYREKTEMLKQGNNWDGYKRTQKLVYAD